MSDPAPVDATATGTTRPATRRTLALVVAVTLLSISLVTGAAVALLYRHYDHNLHVDDITPQLGTDRPTPHPVSAPKGPVNILIMGSDDRDAPGNRIDDLTGIGKRSDTTICLLYTSDAADE